MARLHNSETGSFHGTEKNGRRYAPHTIEEAYEGRRRNWRRDVADKKEGLDDVLQVVCRGLMNCAIIRMFFAQIPHGGAERCLQEQKAVERPRSRGRDMRSAVLEGSRWRSVRCGTAFGFDLKGLETLWQRSSARRVNLRRANRCDRARQAWG